MTFRKLFYALFLITSFSISSVIASNLPKFAITPKVIFKSNDFTNPENIKKIIISKDQSKLYGLGSKGIYTIYLLNQKETIRSNKLFASHGYIDYSDINISKSISPTPYLNSEIVSDSSISMALNPNEKLFYLRSSTLQYKKRPGPNYWFVTTIMKKTIITEPFEDFVDVNGMWAIDYKKYISTGLITYLFMPKIFDVSLFSIYDTNGKQQNDFEIINTLAGEDGFYYLTAINDQFKSYSPSVRIGGSEILGTKSSPNIYKFKYNQKIDGTPIDTNSTVPKFLNVGQGILAKVDKDGILYTIKQDRVIKQTPNTNQFEVVAGGNNIGSAINQLNLDIESQQPIAFDTDGNLYVCDYFNSRIMFYEKGNKVGKTIISKEINNLQGFSPKSIELDQNNNIYIADNFSHSILKFDNCNYLIKPIIQQFSNEEIISNIKSGANWYFNNQLLSNETQNTLRPKASGFYQTQVLDQIGCTSIISDSIYFECKPIKPIVVQNSKTELVTMTPSDPTLFANFDYTITNYGTINFTNKSKNNTSSKWLFSDGSQSTETNPIKSFISSGTYDIKLEVGDSKGGIKKFERRISIQIPSNPNSNLIINIPIRGYNSIWEDISGFQNNASFNGKNNQLTNQGIYRYQGTTESVKYNFSAIKLAGCSVENLNERVIIPNPIQLKSTKAITMSAWFAIDPTVSMNPADGTCSPNGRQVLFSKGGDGYGSSLPGFNSLIDINNGSKALLLEFSKNSGNFNINIPINTLIDTVKKVETFETVYYRNGDEYDSDYRAIYPKISTKFREGALEFPYQHIIISFDENKVIVYINGQKIKEEAHTINFEEINKQDLFIGAMGPKGEAYKGIYNWYPFKGRIDRIKIYNKLISDQEASQLYFEKNSDD